MDIGQFKHRITLVKELNCYDESGFEQVIYEDYITLWAYINNLKGSEFWTAKQLGYENTLEIVVRYNKKLENINTKYGQLNAKDLGQFYTNSLKVRVKTSDGYRELTYNQMTDAQRKNAVNSIMSENAKIVKIMAWTSVGHKYYASLELYNKLKANGITKNIYRGTKGYSD